MAPASDIRPEPTTAADNRRVRGPAPPPGHTSRHPNTTVMMLANLGMFAVGMGIPVTMAIDLITWDIIRKMILFFACMVATWLVIYTLGTLYYRRVLDSEHGTVHAHDDGNGTLHTPDCENDVFNAPDNRNGTLHAKVDEIDLRLTALIASLDKTEEVEAAVEGRLPDPGPTDSEPAAAPG